MAEVEVPRPHEPMAPNETIGNTSPKKRKIDDEDPFEKKLGEKPSSSSAVEKKPRTEAIPQEPRRSSVELNGRKLVFKQESHKIVIPKRRTIEWESFLLDAEEEGQKVTSIPEQHWGIIAMTGHESNARTEALFVKQLKTALTARVGRENDTLSNEALTSLIPNLFTQTDYGLLLSDFPASSSTSKLPTSLQLRCWEAKDLEKHFPTDHLEVLNKRVEERKKARADSMALIEGMDDIEKLELLKGDKGGGDKEKAEKQPKEPKLTTEKTTVASNDDGSAERMDIDEAGPSSSRTTQNAVNLPRSAREGTANTVDSSRSARSVSPVKRSKMTPEEQEEARLKKEEREAKRAAKAEKKAEEERLAEKKSAALAKQAQTMSMFFKKPASSPAGNRKPITTSTASPARPEAGPSASTGSPCKPQLSDFERTFKPVQQRPNVEWAPVNAWAGKNVSVQEAGESSTVQSWSAKDFIRDHLQKHGRKPGPPPRSRLPKGLKTAPLYGTVAEVWQAHQEAEDPRQVLALLKDRERFPWKILAFDDQPRPPYCGTHTKKSVTVGARTPFAQDPALDYTYDSGDDWQDDEGGEDVDDFGEGKAAGSGDEDEEEDDEQGEFDDWLDDSEDVGGGFTRASSEVSSSSEPVLVGSNGVAEQTKLPARQVVKQRIAPKKVVKLTPSWRGPMWEEQIGEGSTGMETYRLQLLNDTPDTIDPFKYTSLEAPQAFKTNFSSTVIGSNLSVKCLLSAEHVTPKPPVPTSDSTDPASTSASTSANPTSALLASSTGGGNATRPGPKVGFPDSHLGELLRAIEGSTKIRTDLVSQLREKFDSVTSKAAIEAKLKEVAVREGKGRDSPWRVLPDAWIAAGLPVPVKMEPTPAPTATMATPSNNTMTIPTSTIALQSQSQSQSQSESQTHQQQKKSSNGPTTGLGNGSNSSGMLDGYLQSSAQVAVPPVPAPSQKMVDSSSF